MTGAGMRMRLNALRTRNIQKRSSVVIKNLRKCHNLIT